MKILIFYASYGGGHYTAANSVKTYLEENYKNIEIKMVDCMKYINLNFEKVTTNAYKSVTKNAPKAWEAIYRISDKEPVLSMSNFGNKIMSQKLNKLVQEFEPDIVISTHPFSTQMIAYLKHKQKTNCKLASIMTDYVPQNQWLVGHEYIDYIFVASEEMKQMVEKCGIDQNKIYATGIPVSSLLYKKYDKAEVAKEYGLDANKDILFFFGGGEYGLVQKTTTDILKAFINNLNEKYEMIVISGKNEELKNEFQKIVNNSHAENKVKVIGFSNEIRKLMNVSTLAITKPGGLTTTECLNTNLPMIIINPIPGQEEDNAKFVEKNGAGVYIKTDKIKEILIKEMEKTDLNLTFKSYECIEKQVKAILNDPEKIKQMKENTKKIAKKNSTRDICNIIINRN